MKRKKREREREREEVHICLMKVTNQWLALILSKLGLIKKLQVFYCIFG